MSLRRDATPLDFAYAVHTEVGNHCVGAKVNGVVVPLSYKLQMGDRVEVLTNKGAKPSRDWMSLVAMPSSRAKIRKYFSTQNKNDDAEQGRTELAHELRKRGYGISTRRTVKAIERVCESFELRSPEDLFASVHTGKVSVKQAANRIEEILEEGSPEQLAAQAAEAERQAAHDAFAHDALRVIALGSRVVEELPESGNLEELEHDLSFEGIVGLIDPPRPEAAEAIALARRAGIRTVMITGDHAATAGAIARQIGLIGPGGTVVTGRQLVGMSDEELVENVRAYSVYARVSPEDKIRIVEAWQEQGEVVAMTGDGVNDAPALKAADVGVAMGVGGTEVAKAAADMVLTDDNFATIVSAVREGRNVFSNIKRTVYFLLACNLSEILIMLGAQIIGWGTPLTPVMLLLINVLGDGIPGLNLARDRSDERIMARRPIGRNESFFSGITRAIAQQTVAFSVVGLLAFWLGTFAWLPGGEGPSLAAGQTMCFLVVAFTSVLHVFTVRSRGSVFRRTVRDNLPLVWSAVGVVVAFSALVLVEPVGAIFGLAPIGPFSWACALGLSVVPTLVAEAFKLWDNRHETWLYRRRLVHHENRGEE